VKEFMDKAVKKKEGREKQKASHDGLKAESKGEASTTPPEIDEVEWADDMMDIAASTDASPADSSTDLKRKRNGDEDTASPKRSRIGTDELSQAPPPPPPPPVEDMIDMDEEFGFTPTDETLSNNGVDKVALRANGHESPLQLATPSTNGKSNGS
jgi:hypothetical protein